MWQQINKIVIRTEKGLISDTFAIGKKFNECFTSAANKLVPKIKTKSSNHKFLGPEQLDSMFLQPTNNSEIEKNNKVTWQQ